MTVLDAYITGRERGNLIPGVQSPEHAFASSYLWTVRLSSNTGRRYEKAVC